MTIDREFYLARAAQEHAMSLNASSPEIATLHRELEAAYRAKLDGPTDLSDLNQHYRQGRGAG